MNWLYKVKIKHLFTEQEDSKSVRASMEAIYAVLQSEICFRGFASTLKKFKNLPDDDDTITTLDRANKLLDKLYDYADANAIWIG